VAWLCRCFGGIPQAGTAQARHIEKSQGFGTESLNQNLLIPNEVQETTQQGQCKVLPMDFFGVLIGKICETGFAPLAPLEKSKATYTLHNVIRDAIGMAERQEVFLDTPSDEVSSEDRETETHITAENADVAYWDYKNLREFLSEIHQLMNLELSKRMGRNFNAVAWAHDPNRTEAEVLELFAKLQNEHPDLVVPSVAVKRPSARLMVQNKRVEAAIANTMAVLVENGSEYGDLLDQCADLDLSNEELLDFLDSKVMKSNANRLKCDNQSNIPRNIVSNYFKYREQVFKNDSKYPTMCGFLAALAESNNFSGNTDETIINRLNQANSSKK